MKRKEEISQMAKVYAHNEAIGEENRLMTYRDFINGAEWADKTIIEKACEWMKPRLVARIGSEDAHEFLAEFRKAMKE